MGTILWIKVLVGLVAFFAFIRICMIFDEYMYKKLLTRSIQKSKELEQEEKELQLQLKGKGRH